MGFFSGGFRLIAVKSVIICCFARGLVDYVCAVSIRFRVLGALKIIDCHANPRERIPNSRAIPAKIGSTMPTGSAARVGPWPSLTPLARILSPAVPYREFAVANATAPLLRPSFGRKCLNETQNAFKHALGVSQCSHPLAVTIFPSSRVKIVCPE